MASLIFKFAPRCQVTMPFNSRVELAVHLAIQIHGSVNEAARRIGVTRSVLFRWQQGVCPHRSNLRGLAQAANVPVAWLEEAKGAVARLVERAGDDIEQQQVVDELEVDGND